MPTGTDEFSRILLEPFLTYTFPQLSPNSFVLKDPREIMRDSDLPGSAPTVRGNDGDDRNSVAINRPGRNKQFVLELIVFCLICEATLRMSILTSYNLQV